MAELYRLRALSPPDAVASVVEALDGLFEVGVSPLSPEGEQLRIGVGSGALDTVPAVHSGITVGSPAALTGRRCMRNGCRPSVWAAQRGVQHDHAGWEGMHRAG